MCTHGEASLAAEGIITGKTVECTFHFGTFDVTTGEPTGMPCEIALKTYPVTIVDGNVRSRSRKWQAVLTVSPLPQKPPADRSAPHGGEPRPNGPRKRGRASSRLLPNSFAGAATPAFEPPTSPPKPGCPAARKLHHFPTKDSLVVATLEYVFEQAQVLSRRRAAAVNRPRDLIEAVIEDAREFFFSEHFMVAIDIVLSTSTDQAVASRSWISPARRAGRSRRPGPKRWPRAACRLRCRPTSWP
jgi:hypothetical protein